jgi:uridine kinase
MKSPRINFVQSPSVIVGIAGGTASCKTSLTKSLVTHVLPTKSAVVELDGYYRDQAHVDLATRANVNYDHPAAFEFSLLERHLSALKRGETIGMPQYDFALHTRKLGAEVQVEPMPLIFVEGILTLAIPEVRQLLDVAIFVDVPDEVRFARRMKRDVEERGRTEDSVRMQWDTTVHPMHCEFCEPSRLYADLIFNGQQWNSDSVKALWVQAQHLLGKKGFSS